MQVQSGNESLEQVGSPRKLDLLPIIGRFLDELGIDQIVDSFVPEHEMREVPVSQSVRALVAAALLGNHTLYDVDELLEQYDLNSLFSGSYEASDFYDTRLGRALDSLHNVGLSNLRSSVILNLVARGELLTRFLHGDATVIQFFGAYNESEHTDPENPDSAPHVTRGYSKRDPAEFKQILASLVTTHDGVPIYFRATDGNRSENLEYQFYIRLLAEQLPNLKDPILVGDSKLCTGPNFQLATSQGIRLLTLLPQNYNIWDEAYERASNAGAEWPLLRARVRRPERAESADCEDEDFDEGGRGEQSSQLIQPTDTVEGTWRGVSVDVTHITDDDKSLQLRALVIESSILQTQKESSASRKIKKVGDSLERLSKSLSKKTRIYNCIEDAESALADLKFDTAFHDVDVGVESFLDKPKRSSRGRPTKEESNEMVTRYRLRLSYSPSAEKKTRWIRRESTFILVTQSELMGDEARLTDAEMLEGYKGQQNTVERRFKTMKGPLNVAPIFLKSPERINALVFIYQIATTIYAMMESALRNSLRDEGAEMPDNRGYTSKPTIESARKLIGGLNTQEVRNAEGNRVLLIKRMTVEQTQLYRRLGWDIEIDKNYRIETVSKLQRGDRGFRSSLEDDSMAKVRRGRIQRPSTRKIYVRPE